MVDEGSSNKHAVLFKCLSWLGLMASTVCVTACVQLVVSDKVLSQQTITLKIYLHLRRINSQWP